MPTRSGAEQRLSRAENDVISLYEMVSAVQRVQAEHSEILAAHGNRFDTIDTTLAAHGNRLDDIDTKLATVDTRLGNMDATLGEILQRLPTP